MTTRGRVVWDRYDIVSYSVTLRNRSPQLGRVDPQPLILA